MKLKNINISYYLIILMILIICFIILQQSIQKEGFNIILKNEINIDFNKYTAIIVEPRKHPALHFVLNNFFENLDDKWNFVILHGTDNIDYLNNIMNRLSKYKSRTTIINLNKNLTYQEYNELLYSKTFYDYIPTETFLIFQTDSMILTENKNKINDFLKYDYVGAPMSCNDMVYKDCQQNSNIIVGNGGLSLRKKSKMLELLKYIDFAKSDNIDEIIKFGKLIPEDRFFSGNITTEYVDIYKPDVQEATNFAVQYHYNDAPFGIHKLWDQGLSNNEMQHIINKYPEINKLIKLNNQN
jgi:hypothetical protein